MKLKALGFQDLQGLEPRLGRADEPLESPEEYVRRVQAALPNFPAPVITQWFFDHSGVIEEYAWLRYKSLRFECVELSESELRLPCLAMHATVVQYRDHFLRGNTSQRMGRIAQYMREFRTWPVPPILLDNPDGAFVASWGLRYSIPYDLLEGHHRLAVLYALQLETAGPHQVWLVRRSSVAG